MLSVNLFSKLKRQNQIQKTPYLVGWHVVEHAPLTENKGHTERQEGLARVKWVQKRPTFEKDRVSDAMIERTTRKMITRQAATERNYP